MRLPLDLGLQGTDFVPGVRVEDQIVAAACPHKQLQRAMQPPHRIRSRVLFLCVLGNSSYNVRGGLSGLVKIGGDITTISRVGYSNEKHSSEGLGLGIALALAPALAFTQLTQRLTLTLTITRILMSYANLNVPWRVPVTLTLIATLTANILTSTLTLLRLSPHRLL